MAAALAETLLPRVTAESAGWSPQDSVARNAVLVIGQVTGLDISGHVPRGVAELDLARFDAIVLLEPRVQDEISVPEGTRLLVWDVEDPYGGSMDDYRRCAEVLATRIRELADD